MIPSGYQHAVFAASWAVIGFLLLKIGALAAAAGLFTLQEGNPAGLMFLPIVVGTLGYALPILRRVAADLRGA